MHVSRRFLAPLALVLAASAGHASRADETRAKPWDWVVVYYMAYDNNLEPCGRPILDMIGKGVKSPRVAVTCLADFTDNDGMRRYTITHEGEKVEQVPGENIAEEETLRDYLEWVRLTFPGRRLALIFLNHGGKLGEMSLDENPGKEGGQNWLEVHATSRVVAAWREAVKKDGGEVELLFLQQCGKGTLENYHAFRDGGKVIMGSQTVVGAPNYYYEKVLRWVGQNPEGSGEDLAAKIREFDPPNMFTTYTAVRGAALDELPARLEPVLAPLLEKERLAAPTGLRSCFDQPPDELFIDGLALLEGLYTQNEVDRAPLDAFAEWVRKDLLAGHRVSPARERVAASWCGFSIYLPRSKRALDRYAHYPIYRETRLDDLVGRLLPPPGAQRQGGRRARERQ
ncbi:MAG: clostripain-related cysteine peptidase [Planctomycetes bacterium]|nr:clostripain-related cysteine peptidase [Planctomycetota bacterium]